MEEDITLFNKGDFAMRTRLNDGTSLPLSVGDIIANSGGVQDTLIPVGAVVKFATGMDGREITETVILQEASNTKEIIKVLGPAGWLGCNGPMTIVSLP